MKIQDLIRSLETWAPPSLQESYDNSGLLCGDPRQEAKGVLVSLDCTEEIVEEAMAKGCNLVVSHHPILFGGLKSLTGKNYVERTVIKAIKNDIALYAIHTNLDNVQTGVNHKIGEMMGLENRRILAPKKGLLKKLVFFTPTAQAEDVLEAVFKAGAGQVGGYSECAFRLEGQGSFKGGDSTNPTIGERGKREYVQEKRAEVLVPQWLLGKVLQAMTEAHPYEEVAHDLYSLDNAHQEIGAGMVGELPKALEEKDFLDQLKEVFGTPTIRHTPYTGKQIKRVAYCGGSGFFLLGKAKAMGADAYFTGDIKYHEFFDAEGRLLLCDIGHYESEQFTIDALESWITDNFPNFAVYRTEKRTNPVQYH